MIENMKQLFDHATRYRTNARYEGREGVLHMGGGERVTLHSPTGKNESSYHRNHDVISLEDLSKLELQDGDYLPMAEYDEVKHAKLIDRLEGLHGFGSAVDQFEQARTRLIESWHAMHADDQEAFTVPEIPNVIKPTTAYRKGVTV